VCLNVAVGLDVSRTTALSIIKWSCVFAPATMQLYEKGLLCRRERLCGLVRLLQTSAWLEIKEEIASKQCGLIAKI
jgi:hypothetical protein